MSKLLPEHIVDQMAKEIAKLIAAVYPRFNLKELEESALAALVKGQPRIQVQYGTWPWPASAQVLSVPIAWYDLEKGHAQVGTGLTPRWFFEERPVEVKPVILRDERKRDEEDDAYWEGRIQI